MSTIQESTEVNVSVPTAYDEWTRSQAPGAAITEQRPGERIAWTSTEGPEHAGVVTLHRLGDARTKVMLRMEVHPDGAAEEAGDALGLARRRARSDLERFREMIEARGAEAGAWRGEVSQSPTL